MSTKMRLIVEIEAAKRTDARDLAGVVEDYAEEQFERLNNGAWSPDGDALLDCETDEDRRVSVTPNAPAGREG